MASYVHLVLERGLVGAPRSVVEWGAAGLGFTLLIASLAASYWLRHLPPSRLDDRSPMGGPGE